jgi:transcriptional regulator with XRE-family HTH domain
MGLTLEDLADTADMAWSYIAAVERGERNISVDNMAALAEAVEIELPLLLSRIPVRVNAGQPATRWVLPGKRTTCLISVKGKRNVRCCQDVRHLLLGNTYLG